MQAYLLDFLSVLWLFLHVWQDLSAGAARWRAWVWPSNLLTVAIKQDSIRGVTV